MHPTLTFELIQQDHRERLETARLIRRAVDRRAADRETGRRPGHAGSDHPPEPSLWQRSRSVLAATTTVAAAR
ncbi:MAG TPA: hypothetical protein VGC67_18005 [Cellulomonas sp.]